MRQIRLIFELIFFVCVLLTANGMDWNTAKELHPGIRLAKFEKKKPRLMRYYIMRIDLRTPGLTFASTGRDSNWGKPMPDCPRFSIRTKRITTAEFMRNARKPRRSGGRGMNMVVAFNASPWLPWESPFTHKYCDPLGTMISDGIIVSEHKDAPPMFVVYKNGSVDIVDKLAKTDYHKVKEAVPGFFLIARNHKVIRGLAKNRELHPRTAFGLSRDRRYLYVIAVDGRQKDWSLGTTAAETAKLLIDAGAWDAINMDGGGSATMCYWDYRKSKPIMVNRHTSGGYMRPVASNIGIVLKK